MADNNNKWKPRPKIIAAGLVGLGVYVLGAFGVDVGTILQNFGEEFGVDVPDQQALSALLAALIAGYIKKDNPS